MVQNHVRWSPVTCSCVLDLMIDSETGNRSLFAIRNICDAHKAIATPDPDFAAKKGALLAARYQQLEDNRTQNYAQIDAYTELQMSAADKAGCKATVDRITAERKREYDLLTESDLIFCVNVHSSVDEESGRWGRIYERVKAQYSLTDEQMQTITWSFSGTPPNRTFTINFYSLITNTQKTNLRTWCDTNLGVGKVVIL